MTGECFVGIFLKPFSCGLCQRFVQKWAEVKAAQMFKYQKEGCGVEQGM